ncbi:MAG: YvcK family protein [Firmicutes bacterium]|nr:YvcK family protein [Bacillota bacterium]
MKRLKWFLPGMGVKRWIGLIMAGLVLVMLGTTLLINTHFFAEVEVTLYRLVQQLQQHHGLFGIVVGVVIIALGLFLGGFGIRRAIDSLVKSIRPEESENLVDVVYKNRSLQKGPKITVIGGGTGLATMLRGLKEHSCNITAIVTVADDGGSSGRIREELGMLPPGDIRNTLTALADTEPLMEKLFQHRFSRGKGLNGHSFGNLFIAAMTEITGDFEEAIRECSKVLAVRGHVIPSTLETVQLRAEFCDGTEVTGESKIPLSNKKIARVCLEPSNATALQEAIESILNSEVVVLGPGSLYTSVIPNLLVDGIVDALMKTNAARIYVCNIMTQPGETDEMTASEHLKALFDHSGGRKIVDYCIINNQRLTTAQRQKYSLEKAFPVVADLQKIEQYGVQPVLAPLINQSDLVRHDSLRLAEEILNISHLKKNNKWVI